ncbi:elongation factor-like GTPase 1 [Paramacrobiotus metropolitanus]|uniref:elongation factor-like GTPase 1 n=1 Tax=Paramacrobiotus metropolitanus TaxID=2943436 RepID=UPI0024465ACF|nr:elongation factor-like GTPase 1 [Paramacrobiotus metropolitanus]XP_055352090.1 elongation factor-like GTPase 1 [Paramacrobiotus metropolitanus]
MASTKNQEGLAALQRDPQRIRNICILAHVDHGKTSLADSLLASNGLISQRLAGRLRYLDDRPDEQQRGITMKASAITLKHTLSDGGSEGTPAHSGTFLVNLIDSPGHVDFCGEVSTAVRVCDGALVVVDAVEGCAAQTVQVLRQAWLENIRPLLVINKVDRLISEQQLSPAEAYQRLLHILEQINALMGALFASHTLRQTELKRERQRAEEDDAKENTAETLYDDWDAGLEAADDSALYFQPEKGNVVFASALDGWGFSIDRFAELYAKKLGLSRRVLNLTLWGDFWLDGKEKRIKKNARARGKKPLFVQLVLDNLWQMYDAVGVKKDKALVEKMAAALGLKIHPRDLRLDPKGLIFALCSQWLPLGKAVLDAVCRQLPSPVEISEERVESLLASQQPFAALPGPTQALKPAFLACSAAPSAPLIAFVSKIFAVSSKHLSNHSSAAPTRGQALSLEEIAARREAVRQRREMAEGDGVTVEEPVAVSGEEKGEELVFLAFARVFSGTLKEGDEVFALGPKYQVDAAEAEGGLPAHASRVVVGAVYCMMGREMQRMPVAYAGNVVGIAGLEGVLTRSGTLSSTLACPAFTDLYTTSLPIVRVAVEPKKTTDLPRLVEGLKLLYQADPCVEVLLQESGEHVLITAGEVHLQRCIRDLQETYAKVDINVSPPIVPFRETVLTTGNGGDASVEMETPDRMYRLKMRAVSLPEATTRLLEDNAGVLKTLHERRKGKRRPEVAAVDEKLEKLKGELRATLEGSGITLESICAFGPRHCGPNVLVNASATPLPSVWTAAEQGSGLMENVAAGFNLATLAGPLCEEPMMGVAFVVEDLQMAPREDEEAAGSVGGGQVISSVKEACRRAFQAQPQRLMLAMYYCVIQASSDVLGKVYSVVSRRHGRVVKDEMVEGSEVFSIATLLPVCESFGLGEEMRKRSSGLALPQLTFSHWEVLEVDPFWTPGAGGRTASEEDYELYGDKADAENHALKYVGQVRRRKGLFNAGEQVVVSAEKQRTVKRNK